MMIIINNASYPQQPPCDDPRRPFIDVPKRSRWTKSSPRGRRRERYLLFGTRGQMTDLNDRLNGSGSTPNKGQGCADHKEFPALAEDRRHGESARWESSLPERAEAQPLPSGEARMTTQEFVVQKLTTSAVAGDGTHLRMNFACLNGNQVSLSLPTESLHGLMMTFPRMMSQALRARHHDETLRLVYPAENIR